MFKFGIFVIIVASILSLMGDVRFRDAVLGILAVAAIWAGVLLVVAYWKKRIARRFEGRLEREFPGARAHCSSEDGSYLVIDILAGQVVVGLRSFRGGLLSIENPYREDLPFACISGVELLRDGENVRHWDLFGSPAESHPAKRLSLRILVNRKDRPVHEVTFYQSRKDEGGKPGEILYDERAQKASQFFRYLEEVTVGGARANTA